MNDNPLESFNAPIVYLRTFNGLVIISFSQPPLSPGITLEGLADLSTPECGIDPIDQSSTSVTTDPLRTPSILSTAEPLVSKDKHLLG